jgi:hypothetical protein
MSIEHVKAACGFGAAMAAHLIIVGENDAPDEQFGRHRRFGVSIGVPGRETCVRIFKGRPFRRSFDSDSIHKRPRKSSNVCPFSLDKALSNFFWRFNHAAYRGGTFGGNSP